MNPKLAAAIKSDKEVPSDLFVGGGHWRNGYNEERLTTLLERNGFHILNISYIRESTIMLLGEMLFPLTYPLSLLLTRFSRKRVEIIIKAKKRN